MSSTEGPTRSVGRAENAFRQAFERLKRNRPQMLAKGSPVTQNNVAKEAGVDPSALRLSRFPDLIREIKAWKSDCSKHSPNDNIRANKKKARDRIATLQKQRDEALSALLCAEAHILELTIRNSRLEALNPAAKIATLPTRKPRSQS